MPLQDPSPAIPASISDILTPVLDFDPSTFVGFADDEPIPSVDLGGGIVATVAGSTPANAKWRDGANGLNGRPVVTLGSRSLLRIPGVFAAPTNRNLSIYWVSQITTLNAQLMFSYLGTATNTNLWVNTGTVSPQGWKINGGGIPRIGEATGRTRGDGWHSGYLSSDHDSGSGYEVKLGGMALDFQAPRAANSGITAAITDGNGLQIGADSTSMGAGYARLVVFPRKLKWDEHLAVSRYLSTTYATYNGLDQEGVVICLGNSTTHNGPPFHLAKEISAALGWGVINLGYSSGTVATMTAQDPEITECIAAFRELGKKVVIVLHHGHNNGWDSVYLDHLRSAQFAAYRAMGAHIVACTPTPWWNKVPEQSARLQSIEMLKGALQPGFESRPGYVSHYSGALDGPSYYDSLVDLDAHADLSTWVTPDEGDPTTLVGPPELYDDGVHQNDAGRLRIAQLQAPVVIAAVDVTPGLIDPAVPSKSSGTADSLTIASTDPDGGKAPYTRSVRIDGSEVEADATFPYVAGELAAATEYSVVLRTTDATGYYRDSAPVLMSTEGDDPEPDVTPPSVESVVIPPAGDRIRVSFSEPTTGDSGFTGTVDGDLRASAGTRVDSTTVDLMVPGAPITTDQAAVLGYDAVGGDVQDLAGNPLATISGRSVVNNSTQTPDPGPSWPGWYRPREAGPSTVTVVRSAGSTTLTVDDATSFGTVTEADPVRLSLYRVGQDRPYMTLKATGLDANVFTLDGPLDGSTDLGCLAGDVVACVPRAADIADVWAALVSLGWTPSA